MQMNALIDGDAIASTMLPEHQVCLVTAGGGGMCDGRLVEESVSIGGYSVPPNIS